MISALTLAGVSSQSASGIPAGSALITGGLYLGCNRKSNCRQGFNRVDIRDEPSRPLNGYLSSRPMHIGNRQRPPLSPQEGWISNGRHVLHFRPTRWDRWCQQLEVTVGELLPDQPVPLLKRRLELSRKEALKLWSERRKEGWQPTKPQWRPPKTPAKE